MISQLLLDSFMVYILYVFAVIAGRSGSRSLLIFGIIIAWCWLIILPAIKRQNKNNEKQDGE
jgi:hypothetical protein